MSDLPTDPAAPRSKPVLTARSFTTWPAWADLSLDVVHYGPDIPTEAELRLMGNLDGKRVLELGCGGGPASVAMAKQGAKVIAVDESAEQVAHARRLAEREEVKVEFRQGDLADLAFVRADTVDIAVSVLALGSVDDLDRVFRQVHRVLRPEAPFVFSVVHPAFRAVDTTTEPPLLRRSYFDRSLGVDEHPHTISDLFTSLLRANFRVDNVLEPEPAGTGIRSRYWVEAMRWIPSTLILRGRKLGI